MSSLIPIDFSMDEKVTSKVLLSALRRKYPDAAILGEVTMEDEEEAHRARTAHALRSPYFKRWYTKKGLTYDAVLPDDYDVSKSVPVRRIDALMFEGQTRTAVEIKISRADFFRETEAKRYPWVKHTDRFVYLVPKGLVKVEEVPEGCGLWEYTPHGIAVAKRAKVNKNVVPFPESMVRYFAWRAFSAEQKLR